MGLTFKRDDELQKALDKFAILPDDNPKDKDKPKPDAKATDAATAKSKTAADRDLK